MSYVLAGIAGATAFALIERAVVRYLERKDSLRTGRRRNTNWYL